MPEHNAMLNDKFFFGEKEFTSIMWVLIRSYRFRNRGKDPQSIVIPEVFEVGGVKIEFPKAKRPASQPSDPNS